MNHTALSLAAPFRLLLLAVILGFACGGALVQAADYTNDLPSVERVKAEIKGSDATDSLARQVAVFEYLQVYIQRIKQTRDYRGPYSPGETKLLTDYAKAQYDLTQSYTKTHTPGEVAAFNQKEGNYSMNNALDWIKQLEGTQAADTYKGTEAALAASSKAFEEKIQQDLKQFNSSTSGGSPNSGGGGLLDGLLGGGGGGPLDASQKRCLELGGSYNECTGALMGVFNAVGTLLTGSSVTGSSGPPPLNGVILVGMYHSRTDLPELALTWDGNVSLQKCGTLVDANHTYTLRKSGGTTQIVVANEPDPIVLTIRADGSLSGPGSIQVKGNIITGYHNEYVCTNGNCTTSSTPVYGPKIDRCALSLLAPQPPPPPPTPVKEKGFMDEMADEMVGAGTPVATIYGLRITGDYAASTGMKLSFNNSFVTLDCGQAHVKVPYAVESTATQFVVHVQNGGGAFLLAVAPDNTLRGSGSTTVNGKLFSAVNGQSVSFTPHSESCNVGAFAPRGGLNTMVASNAPMPSMPAYSGPALAAHAGPTPAPAPVASFAAASPGPAQNMTLAITSSFPIAKNPLAGMNVALMSERYDIALRKVGGPIAADVTPGKALLAYMANCGPPKSCPPLATAMHPYFVGKGTFDNNGNVTVTAPIQPGTYYVFCSAAGTKGALIWDLPVTLKAGDNAITLTATNAELVQ